MGTAVLRPQNLMVERFKFQATTSFQQRRRNFPSSKRSHLTKSNNSSLNNNSSSSSSSRSDKRRSTRLDSNRKHDDVTSAAGLVNGQVTLLKRGESLDSIVSEINGGDCSAISSSSNRKPSFQICVPPQANVYAGSAFFSSPSPRNLPLPTFSSSNKKQVNDQLTSTDDLASRDLRRLLRLN